VKQRGISDAISKKRLPNGPTCTFSRHNEGNKERGEKKRPAKLGHWPEGVLLGATVVEFQKRRENYGGTAWQTAGKTWLTSTKKIHLGGTDKGMEEKGKTWYLLPPNAGSDGGGFVGRSDMRKPL